MQGSLRCGGAVQGCVAPQEAAEELRLWADYYEARARVLEIMSRDGTAGAALSDILNQDSVAQGALARIKKIRGVK
jgi:hypothetical protein